MVCFISYSLVENHVVESPQKDNLFCNLYGKYRKQVEEWRSTQRLEYLSKEHQPDGGICIFKTSYQCLMCCWCLVNVLAVSIQDI